MKAKFIKAVEGGDLVSVRLFIANELMLDPRGESFSEMKIFAEAKFSNLYDTDDAKTYSFTMVELNKRNIPVYKDADKLEKDMIFVYTGALPKDHYSIKKAEELGFGTREYELINV